MAEQERSQQQRVAEQKKRAESRDVRAKRTAAEQRLSSRSRE
jgi:hypothetical protein